MDDGLWNMICERLEFIVGQNMLKFARTVYRKIIIEVTTRLGYSNT